MQPSRLRLRVRKIGLELSDSLFLTGSRINTEFSLGAPGENGFELSTTGSKTSTEIAVDGTISSGGKYPWDIKCSNPLGPINYFEYGKGHNASIGFSIVSLQSGQWKFRLTVSSNMVTRGLIRNNEIRRRR